jgi:predicted chitinase
LTITRRINGGLNGLEDRKQWLTKLKKVYGIA